MGIINKRIRFKVGDVRVVIRRMSINIGVYKRHGVVVILRARRGKRNGTIVAIDNFYYVNLGGTLDLAKMSSERSSGKRRTELSEYKVFLFYGGDPGSDASTSDPNHPIVGVISSILVEKGSDSRHIVTHIGSTDPSFVVSPPRI